MIEVTTATRPMKNAPAEIHFCTECDKKFTEDPDYDRNPATHGVTDSRETLEGWIETEYRYGCDEHPVTSMAYFLNGNSMPTNEAIKLFEPCLPEVTL